MAIQAVLEGGVVKTPLAFPHGLYDDEVSAEVWDSAPSRAYVVYSHSGSAWNGVKRFAWSYILPEGEQLLIGDWAKVRFGVDAYVYWEVDVLPEPRKLDCSEAIAAEVKAALLDRMALRGDEDTEEYKRIKYPAHSNKPEKAAKREPISPPQRPALPPEPPDGATADDWRTYADKLTLQGEADSSEHTRALYKIEVAKRPRLTLAPLPRTGIRGFSDPLYVESVLRGVTYSMEHFHRAGKPHSYRDKNSKRFCNRCHSLWKKSESDPSRCGECFAPREERQRIVDDEVDAMLSIR